MLSRIALTIGACTCLLSWASLGVHHTTATENTADEWTEISDDPLTTRLPADRELVGDKTKQTQTEARKVDKADSNELIATGTPRCGEPCADPLRYGNEPWETKCKKVVCMTCEPCTTKEDKSGATRRRRGTGSSKNDAEEGTTRRRRGTGPSKHDSDGGDVKEGTTRRRRGTGPSKHDSDGGDTPAAPDPSTAGPPGKKLVWSDEFDSNSCVNGRPGPHWGYEEGFVRNEEHQWYQKENARCVDGKLVITSGKHPPGKVPNPNYQPGSKHWKTNRRYITYTSSALTTKGKRDFGLGTFEMRAKVDVREGSWPAWWTLGSNINEPKWSWPRCGEIDMMEVFGKSSWEKGPVNKANMIWGTSGYWDHKRNMHVNGKTDRSSKKMNVDAKWGEQWHVFKMERTATTITLYVDGTVLNRFDFSGHKQALETFAAHQKIFMIVNLALGGCCGGNPDTNKGAPFKLEVDYIRVYH